MPFSAGQYGMLALHASKRNQPYQNSQERLLQLAYEETMSDDANKEVDSSKDRLLYPIGRYRGKFKVGNVAFNANLQEFAQKIGYVCNLETGGKISSQDAYDQIKELWKQLKKSKKALLDTPEPPLPDLPSDDT